MRSAIVLGAGRSGTSLLAGLFHGAGYFSGDSLWPPTVSNPVGYFEDAEVNAINEDLLSGVAPWRPRGAAGVLLPVLRDRPRWSQRWLLTLPAGTDVPVKPALNQRMATQTARQPYLFKDPRFSYTLPAWRPHLAPDTVFMCIFREPQRTINSIMKVVRDERYLRDLRMSTERAARYWEAVYRSVLYQRSVAGGKWLFVHYDELLSGPAIPVLEDHLEAKADRAMLRSELKRSSLDASVPVSLQLLFRELSTLSEEKYSAELRPDRPG